MFELPELKDFEKVAMRRMCGLLPRQVFWCDFGVDLTCCVMTALDMAKKAREITNMIPRAEDRRELVGTRTEQNLTTTHIRTGPDSWHPVPESMPTLIVCDPPGPELLAWAEKRKHKVMTSGKAIFNAADLLGAGGGIRRVVLLGNVHKNMHIMTKGIESLWAIGPEPNTQHPQDFYRWYSLVYPAVNSVTFKRRYYDLKITAPKSQHGALSAQHTFHANLNETGIMMARSFAMHDVMRITTNDAGLKSFEFAGTVIQAVRKIGTSRGLTIALSRSEWADDVDEMRNATGRHPDVDIHRNWMNPVQVFRYTSQNQSLTEYTVVSPNVKNYQPLPQDEGKIIVYCKRK